MELKCYYDGVSKIKFGVVMWYDAPLSVEVKVTELNGFCVLFLIMDVCLQVLARMYYKKYCTNAELCYGNVLNAIIYFCEDSGG